MYRLEVGDQGDHIALAPRHVAKQLGELFEKSRVPLVNAGQRVPLLFRPAVARTAFLEVLDVVPAIALRVDPGRFHAALMTGCSWGRPVSAGKSSGRKAPAQTAS